MKNDERYTSDRWASDGAVDGIPNPERSMALLVVMIGMLVLFAIMSTTSPSRKDVSAVSSGKGLEPSTKEMKCALFSSKDGVTAIEAMRRWQEAHPKASIITTFPVGIPPTEYYAIYVENK